MCGINKPYLPWFSHYFTFKFWWRHNDVIMRSQNFLNYPKPQFRSRSWKPVVGLSPISFTFLKLSVAKLVINYLAVESTVGYLYTSIFLYIGPWESQNSACTQLGIQFKYTYLEHSRVKICHRGATGQRGWALARARMSSIYTSSIWYKMVQILKIPSANY